MGTSPSVVDNIAAAMNKLFLISLAILAALAQGGVVNREDEVAFNKAEDLLDEAELDDDDWEDEEDEDDLDDEDDDDEDDLEDDDDDEDEDDLEDDDDEDEDD